MDTIKTFIKLIRKNEMFLLYDKVNLPILKNEQGNEYKRLIIQKEGIDIVFYENTTEIIKSNNSIGSKYQIFRFWYNQKNIDLYYHNNIEMVNFCYVISKIKEMISK